MPAQVTRAALAATALLAGASAARAADVLSWPSGHDGKGSAFAADTLLLGDYAQIVTGSGGLTFTDTGYLPIEGFALNGKPVAAAGFNDPSGNGWGAFIRYTGTGTQTLSPYGFPATATYTQLSYQVVAYDGLATFGFGASGAAAVPRAV